MIRKIFGTTLAIALMGTHYVNRLGMRPAAPGDRLPTFREILDAAEAGGEHEYAAAVRYSRAMNLLSKGEPEAFFRAPKHERTRAFLGEILRPH